MDRKFSSANKYKSGGKKVKTLNDLAKNRLLREITMWSIKCTLALAALMLMLSLAKAPFCVFAIDETDVRSVIAAAEENIVVCYRAIADADEAGANTTALLAALNEAGELLSRANLAYKMGDSDSALDFANQSQERLNGFVPQAVVSRETAVQQHYWDFMVNVVGSIVGAAAVICGGFVVWFFLKRKYGEVGKGSSMSLREFRVLFMAATGILALLVASPALSRLLVLPRTEFFTELWILGSDHMAENYPFSISRNHNYSVFLGIGNRLGYCSYYLVEVKFRNQSQPAPDSFNRTPSSLPSLFNITAFVADEEVWELPLTFSFNYGYNGTVSKVEFFDLTLNGVTLDMKNYTVAWDSEKKEFFGDLFFELWIYDKTYNFQYHERFLNLRLNMTSS